MIYVIIYLGRLSQLIHIPLPDDQTRLAIIELYFKKAFIVKNFDMDYLVDVTKDFNSANVTKICQQACVLATKESIKKQEQQQRPYPTTTSFHSLFCIVKSRRIFLIAYITNIPCNVILST